jgi:hypothetical protein
MHVSMVPDGTCHGMALIGMCGAAAIPLTVSGMCGAAAIPLTVSGMCGAWWCMVAWVCAGMVWSWLQLVASFDDVANGHIVSGHFNLNSSSHPTITLHPVAGFFARAPTPTPY